MPDSSVTLGDDCSSLGFNSQSRFAILQIMAARLYVGVTYLAIRVHNK